MKTSTLKKVLSIVIVSVVLALVAVTIILAVVPKKFGNPISTDYVTISVHKDGQKNRFEYHDGATEANFVKNNKIFKEIGRLHEESLKDTLLSAIFQGTGTFKINVVQDPKGDALGEVSTGYGLIFNYLQPQTLKVDGKELKYERDRLSLQVKRLESSNERFEREKQAQINEGLCSLSGLAEILASAGLDENQVEQLLAGVMFRINTKIATEEEKVSLTASGPQNA